MLDTALVNYLGSAGIAYQPAQTSALRSHLEGHFSESHSIGSKFSSMPDSRVAELIAEGEKILLDELAATFRKTGHIDRVTRVLDLPYVVGTDAVKPRAEVDASRLIRLVQYPGAMQERIIDVLPTPAEAIPSTHKVTVEGGLYADGTVGYYDLYPGDATLGGKEEDKLVFLATPEEIRGLIREMQASLVDITVATGPDCEAMIQRAKKSLRRGHEK